MNKPGAPSLKTAFAKPDAAPGSLSAVDAASLLAAVGDVAFILSADGTVCDFSTSQSDFAAYGMADWIGGAFVDTVTIESRPKIEELLADAAVTGKPPRWRQVNHPVPGGEVPIRYLVMRLGDGGRLIAIGRDMRNAAAVQQRLLQTQQSLERDYIRLRQAESRYRMLFDMAAEPVLIVDAQTRGIREANPAAHRLLDRPDGDLIGSSFADAVDRGDRDRLIAYLGAAEARDEMAPTKVRLADRRGEVEISARLFRQARSPLLVVRLASSNAAAPRRSSESLLSNVVERMPDAFVMADRDLKILTANAAFLELIDLPSADRVVGAQLGDWLGRPNIDLDLIVGQLREHSAVRNVATIMRGVAGEQEEVELSGVVAATGGGEVFGFTIRNVGRRLREMPVRPQDVPRSVEQLTELVGRMSLKDIVRESTDLVERLCIEAALAYTSDNRASAAEILGVSRQSLYSKLHRHGLGNLVSDNG